MQLEDAVEDAVEEEEELAWQEGREAGPQVTQQRIIWVVNVETACNGEVRLCGVVTVVMILAAGGAGGPGPAGENPRNSHRSAGQNLPAV